MSDLSEFERLHGRAPKAPPGCGMVFTNGAWAAVPYPPRRTRSGAEGRKLVVITGDGVWFSDGQIIETAASAARLLGVTPSWFYQQFKSANGAPAKLRGVTFQYLDVYQKGKSNESAS